MAYLVIRTVNGRQYRYLQVSYRDGRKVKTVSRYLGPVEQMIRPHKPRRSHMAGRSTDKPRPEFPIDEAAMLRDARAREALHGATIARFENETGLKIGPRDPVPVEKPTPTVGALMSAPANTSDASAGSGASDTAGAAATTDDDVSR